MKQSLSSLENAKLPVRLAIRRARWFVTAFRDYLRAVEAETGTAFALDDARLLSAFTDWFRAFEAQKQKAAGHRLDYVTFAAGLMLRELVRNAPASARPQTTTATSDNTSSDPAVFWPEGHLYVSFCLAVRDAVIEQDFVSDLSPTSSASPVDIRSWWSFRENVVENIDLATGFFEYFAGEPPNWSMPGLFLPKADRALLREDFQTTL